MKEKRATWYYLALLIIAGESVFILPFVLARVFRPTVLEVFEIDNIELGFCFSTYGIVALISYLFGGPIADKFNPRKLMAVALWMTSLGGLFYSTFPSYHLHKFLYGYWGFTTIFLFWAPMIKATRLWGGPNSQGKAFGFLDGGRGLVGALFGILGVYILSIIIPNKVGEYNINELQAAFKYVIVVSSLLVGIVGILVWFYLKLDNIEYDEVLTQKISFSQIKEVIKIPSVWMLMIIILCAYVGYKSTDILSTYANDVMLFDKVKSAKVGTLLLSIRPIIGVLIGITADRTNIVYWLPIGFGLSVIGSLLFASGIVTPSSYTFFTLSTIILGAGVYASRSLYFAVLDKGHVPLALTGTAIGIISLIGYTPDIFATPVIGYLIESSPGIIGHQRVFWMLAAFSIVGGFVSYRYYRLYK